MKRMKWMVALLCSSVVFAGAAAFAACGDEEHAHVWTWKSDADVHWQICEADNAEKEGSRGAHADADNDGKCDSCDRTLASGGGHTHVWTWRNDDAQHWQICEADNTEKEGSRGAHADADDDGKCDDCKYAMAASQPQDSLFPVGYIGTWEFETSYGEGRIALEIEADSMKYNGEEVTVTKKAEGSKTVYSFAGIYETIPFDFSFYLTDDGYAILFTLAGEKGEDTITLLEEGYTAPELIAAPERYTGTWKTADGRFSLIFSEGKVFFGDEPVTILTLNEAGTHATAFGEVESTLCWLEIEFEAASITVKAPGELGTFVFAQAEELIDLPAALCADWAEYGKEEGHTLSIAAHSIEFDGKDVTDTVNENDSTYYFLADDVEYSFALTQDGNVIYMQSEADENAYILFGTVDEDGASELPDLALTDFAGKTYSAGAASTAGNLAFGANGKGTLGGKTMRILSVQTEKADGGDKTTGFTFLCDGMWYDAAVEENITLTDLAGKTYKFEGESLADLSDYVGEWKQFYPSKTVTITITETEFKYNDDTMQCFRAADGSVYYKQGVFKVPFGFLDEEKNIFYVKNGAGWFFNKSGEAPTGKAFPESFYGAWLGETFGRLTVSAASADIRGNSVQPFAVTGDAGDEVVHAIYNNEYWTFRKTADAELGEVVVMANSTISYKFAKIVASPLDQEYIGEWKQLGGDATVSVDSDGKLKYNNVAYEAVRDDQDYGFHFTLDNKTATIMVSSDGFVLWIVDGEGAVTYFTKDGQALPDLTISSLKSTAWDNSKLGTLTFDETGKAKIGTDAVRILTQEPENGDTIGTLIYDNVWYDFRISGATFTLQGMSGETVFTKQGAQQEGKYAAELCGNWQCKLPGDSGTVTVTFKIEASSAIFNGAAVQMQENEGAYLFTAKDLFGGAEDVTYKVWLASDKKALLVDTGMSVIVFFKEDFATETTTVSAKFAAGDYTGANGAKVQVGSGDNAGELFITERSLELSGDPVWLLSATDTAATGYTKVYGAYVWLQISMEGQEMTVMLLTSPEEPTVLTLNKAAAQLQFPAAMRCTWAQFDASYEILENGVTIEIEKNSIKYNGTDVTASAQLGEGNAVTFVYQNKKYTAQLTENDSCLYVKAEGETKSTVYVDVDRIILDLAVQDAQINTNWTSSNMGTLTFGQDKKVKIGGKAVRVIGIDFDADEGMVAFYTLYDGMWYHFVQTGNTLTATDADGNTFTFTKAE